MAENKYGNNETCGPMFTMARLPDGLPFSWINLSKFSLFPVML